MTSHFPDHAFLVCNKAALLKDGSIIDIGKPEEIVTSKSLTNLYKTPICVAEAEIDKYGEKLNVCIPIMD